MKKQLLKALLVLVAGLLGSTSASADTSVIANETDGWTKITSIPTNVDDYYFVFVDNSQDLMLSFGEGHNQSEVAAYKTMVYRTSEDPAMNPAMLWTLTANSDGYSIKSAVESTYYIQTEWDKPWFCRTHDNGGGDASWYKWILAYTDGSWTIQNGKYTDKGYIGGWDETPKNGLNVAANNTASDKIGKFQIYSILKTDVDWQGNASESKPANYSYMIANSYAAYNGTAGWTSEGTGLNSDGRNDGNGFDGIPGFFEYWNGNTYSGTLSQTISNLPTGRYIVRAAAQLASANTTLNLSANGTSVSFDANGTSNGTISQSGAEVAAGSGVAGWQYKSVTTTVPNDGAITITFTSVTTAGGCWTNFDNVELYYLGPVTSKEDYLLMLSTLLSTCAPYGDVTDNTEYTTHYNAYQNYDDNNSVEEIQAAIKYIQDNYPNYQWANASITHPVEVTEGIINDADCTDNTKWDIGLTGRSTESAQDETGTTRVLFYQNVEPNAVRGQAITIPETGAYMLKTWVRNVNNNANTYAKISICDGAFDTNNLYANEEDIAAIYGNESTAWTQLTNYFATLSVNQQKTIYLNMSHGGEGRKAYVSRLSLYYIGQNVDFVKDGVRKYIGTYATAPAIELTDAVPVVNITSASMSGATLSFTNPNGLVFAGSNGQVNSTAKNVVVSGTCASLQLEKGHPFVNPTEFTATSAKYTMNSNELADGSFATLTVPFAANVPSGGKAYALDQTINLIDGNVYATEVSSIAANSPVLVTAAGNYTGSGVTVPVVAQGATFTNGELIGTYTPMTAVENSYVLQNHTSGEGVAFYIVGSTKPTVNPFRAYIKPQSSNARAIKVVFDDDAQGIENVNANANLNDNVNECYDMQGRRVTMPTKGLYIVNGQKTVIK